MPRTILDEKTKWLSLTEFAEFYNISKAQASRIINRQEFEHCRRKLGEKTIRIELYEADKIIQMIWRWGKWRF